VGGRAKGCKSPNMYHFQPNFHIFGTATAGHVKICILTTAVTRKNKNSSGDEIASVNVYDDIVHVEASAYDH